MARGSRSRASRAERRMQKERAASALQRGLPVPTPLPKRAPSATPRVRANVNSSDRLRTPSLGPANSRQRMPLAVKLLGLGLGVLGLVYGLTLVRDHKSSPDPAAARANMSGAAVK
jgi:hypothetical protein